MGGMFRGIERERSRQMSVSSPDMNAFLAATPLFGGLTDANLDLLASMLVERQFEAGGVITAEGEPGRSIYVIRSGKIAVNKSRPSGRPVEISCLADGDFIGEMATVGVQSRSATLVAKSPVILYELTARSLYAFYKADVHAYVMVLQNINRELCRRLRWADNRIAELTYAETVPEDNNRPEGMAKATEPSRALS